MWSIPRWHENALEVYSLNGKHAWRAPSGNTVNGIHDQLEAKQLGVKEVTFMQDLPHPCSQSLHTKVKLALTF